MIHMNKRTLIKIVTTVVFITILISVSIYFIYNQYYSNDNVTLHDNLLSDQLIQSAIMAGDYLINASIDGGIFAYEYDPLKNTVDISKYNILRHAGTVYSMLKLYNDTKNEQLLKMSEKSLAYLLSFVRSFENASCVAYNNEIKLGGNALSIIALVEYTKLTDNEKQLTTIQSLAKYIKQSQKETGEFICKRYYPTGETSDFISQYYPGEAILALCRLYDLDKNETWLDTAENGAKYLIQIRDANYSKYELVHDHWLLMALNELYRNRDNPLYFNHSMRIAESIINMQRDGINKESVHTNWIGSYYTPPGSTPTATRSEGLIAAYELAKDFGNTTTVEKIYNAIELGIKFQLQTQFRTEEVINLPDPQQAIGGFHESLTDYNIRIDYVQHNICSILGLYHIINE